MSKEKKIENTLFVTAIILFVIGLLPALTGYWSDNLYFKITKLVGVIVFGVFVFFATRSKNTKNVEE